MILIKKKQKNIKMSLFLRKVNQRRQINGGILGHKTVQTSFYSIKYGRPTLKLKRLINTLKFTDDWFRIVSRGYRHHFIKFL